MSHPDAGDLVSVVVPTWNRAAVLPRALRSIESQSRPADEVVVIDDGSTDETAAIIARDFPRIRLIRQPQRGVSAARNAGIRSANGNYIALLDSDDEWRPEKLERQLEVMDRQPEAALCHTDEIWIRRGKRVNPMHKHQKYGGLIFERCLPLCVISPSSALIRRSVLENVGLFDEELPACEDYDLWLRITSSHPVAFLAEKLTVKHGGHADQLSQRHWGMDRFRIRALEKILAQGGLDAGQERAARATLREKAAIFAAGARKRGREDEAADYESRSAT